MTMAEYLHTDALASGATRGARTLRAFTNLHVPLAACVRPALDPWSVMASARA